MYLFQDFLSLNVLLKVNLKAVGYGETMLKGSVYNW